MKSYIIVLLLLFTGTSFLASAQKSKGDKYFASYDYRDAIDAYQKALKSNAKDTGILNPLAACYRILRDYDNAETYYAKAAASPKATTKIHFYYGQILKNNGKIDAAKAEFVKCTILDSKDSAAARVRMQK